tara:strand:- start:239 stop:1126 length:888 start_codon:yes stop_codon:yes gene_type:complete
MPTIIPSYTYTDGTVLDSSGHNQNIYDNPTGRGIMSTANGGIDTNNLHTGFKIRSEHIMPQTAIRTSEEFDLTDIDCFEDIFAADINDPSTFSYNDAPSRLFLPVPGCGLSFYLPRSAKCLLRVGAFIHPFKIGYNRLGNSARDVVYDCAIALKLDGALIESTRRPLPNTARYLVDGSFPMDPGQTSVDYTERETAIWYDFHHITTLDAGPHDIQLCLYIERVDLDRDTVKIDGETIDDNTSGQVTLGRMRQVASSKDKDNQDTSIFVLTEKQNPHLLFQRATFGVRHARVLALS